MEGRQFIKHALLYMYIVIPLSVGVNQWRREWAGIKEYSAVFCSPMASAVSRASPVIIFTLTPLASRLEMAAPTYMYMYSGYSIQSTECIVRIVMFTQQNSTTCN